MSNEPEEFEQLRKLLRLKRCEQPPPRFFNEFSGRVIAGIETEAAQNPAERLLARASWLAGFIRTLERNALVAGSFVTSVCALLVGGIVYSEYMDQTADASSPVQPMPSRMVDAAGYLPVEGSSLESIPVFSPSNSLPDSLFRRVGLPSPQNQNLTVQQINWNVPVPQ